MVMKPTDKSENIVTLIICAAIAIALVLCAWVARSAERGAERLARSRAITTTTIHYITRARPIVIQWDPVDGIHQYELAIMDGLSATNTIIASTISSETRSAWLSEQTPFRSRIRTLWVRSVATNGLVSEWSGGLRFLKLD